MRSSPQPLVSITIPTYNRAESYLRGTIESALAQTYLRTEVIVADNASTDATPDLVRSFDDERLRYERHAENIGPFRNWQFCLDAAQGDFIYMLHDDDLVDPDFLATCVAALADEPDAGFVRTGLRTIDADGQVLQDFPNRIVGLQGESYVDAWLRRRAYWYFSNSLIRTNALRALDGAFTRYLHTSDCATFARLALAHRGADVEDVKASCRLHDEKLTRAAEVSSWVQEYRALRDDVVRLAADEWQDRLRAGANDFFSEICYRHAERIPGRLRQLLMMGRIYRAFEWSRIPPVLSRASRRLLPASLIRWIRARRFPSAAA
jgi:glycosyltransferase involved in cell wall biosynthesis